MSSEASGLTAPRRWDIFCRAVDNFGDIGVCWRLACILAAEHGCQVRLIHDCPELLQRIAPDAAAYSKASNGGAVELVCWSNNCPSPPNLGVVVEAFACDPPADYIDAMATGIRAPLWINLEYLSAEPWISGCHLLDSTHPRLALQKTFFFPGFDASSGGLLRECDLFERRDAFRADGAAQRALWSATGLAPPLPGERRASLFGYPNRAVDGLLAALSEAPERWTLLVPEGHSVAAVAAWFGGESAESGRWQRGQLQARVIPFSDQRSYDQLLWACDLNLVRGEDSLVRALWAGRPMLWQAYPQQDDAHLPKVEAFAERLEAAMGGDALAALVGEVMRGWNRGAVPACAWRRLLAASDALAPAFGRTAEAFAEVPELASSLVRFAHLKVD